MAREWLRTTTALDPVRYLYFMTGLSIEQKAIACDVMCQDATCLYYLRPYHASEYRHLQPERWHIGPYDTREQAQAAAEMLLEQQINPFEELRQ